MFQIQHTIRIHIDQNQPIVSQVVASMQKGIISLSNTDNSEATFRISVFFTLFAWLGQLTQFFFNFSFRMVKEGEKSIVFIQEVNHEDLKRNMVRLSEQIIKCLEQFSWICTQPQSCQIKYWLLVNKSLLNIKIILSKILKLKEQHELINKCIRQLFKQNSANQNSSLKIQFSQNVDRIYADFYLLYNIFDKQQGNDRQIDGWRKMEDNNYLTQASRKKQLADFAFLLKYFIQKFATTTFLNNITIQGLPSRAHEMIISKANQIMDNIMNINNPEMEDVLDSFAYLLSNFYRQFKQVNKITKTSKFCSQKLNEQNLQRILKRLTNMQIHKFISEETYLNSSDKNYGAQFIQYNFGSMFEPFYFSQILKVLLNQTISLLINSKKHVLQLLKTVSCLFLILMKVKNRDLYYHIQSKSLLQFLSHFLVKILERLKESTMDAYKSIKSDQAILNIQLDLIEELTKTLEELSRLIQKKSQEYIQDNNLNIFINKIQDIRINLEAINRYLGQVKEVLLK